MRGSSTVTVLFCDLVGSTRVLNRLGPEAADQVRRQVDNALRRVMESRRGEVVKHTGDGFMVVFGSAADAAAAGAAGQAALLRERTRDSRVPDLRVGLASGEAVYEDGDWFGPPAVEAARLCTEAEGGQILATQVVALLVGARGGHSWTPLGERLLKGFDTATPVVELSWTAAAGADVPQPDAARAAAAVPLVGREEALAALRAAWKRAESGQRAFAVVSGEPGIGKTRVAAALATEVHEAGAVVLWGHCDEELVVPYQPWIQALRHLTDHMPDDDLARLPASRHLVRLLPDLAQRLADVAEAPRGEPELERWWLFEAVADILSASTRQVPLLIVLDDLHWATGPTLLLLRHIAQRADSAPMLVLGTYRDSELDRRHPLASVLADLRRDDAVERIKLVGLSSDATAELVERVAGETLDDRGLALAAMVHAETEGNPFFVWQVLRHLAETGSIVRRDGHWTADRPLAELGIPEGVREVIGRRLSRLSVATNRLLAAAAVIGRDFELRLLEQVVEDVDVLDGLEEAIGARLVAETAGTTGTYAFGHALVRQTLLADQSAVRRARLHRRIGTALAATPGADAALVALHLCNGATRGDTNDAIDWSLAAITEANDSLAWEQALAMVARAFELTDLEDAVDHRARCVLHLARNRSLFQAGDIAGSKQAAMDALAEAELVGDANLIVDSALARTGWGMTGVVDPEGMSALQRALAIVGEGEPAARAKLLATTAFHRRISDSAGPEADALGAKALAVARASGDESALAMALAMESFLLLANSRLEEQEAVLDELDAIATSSGFDQPDSRAVVLRNRFVLSLQRGDTGSARRCVDEWAERFESRSASTFEAMWTATLALLRGDFDIAEANNARILDWGGGDVNFVNSWIGQLVDLRIQQGRGHELVGLLAQAAEQTGLVALQTLLAVCIAEAGDLDAARAILEPLIADDLAKVPRDMLWSTSLAQLATVCGYVEDRDGAAALHPHLVPFDGQLMVCAWGVICLGAAARYLGITERLLGRTEDAEAHFAAAVALENDAGAPALAERTRRWWR